MRRLLDVNVLIALLDPMHTQHDAAHAWFGAGAGQHWASCPMTQNAGPRIVGHARYPNSPGSPVPVVAALAAMCSLPGHEFWADDVSLLDGTRFDHHHLLDSGQVTDSYLLALALAHGGQLATFDRRLVPDAVRGGSAGLLQIPN